MYQLLPMRSALQRVLFVFCYLLLCLFAFLPSILLAQQQAGVSISPARFEERLDPGAEVTRQMTVRNRTDEEETYFILTRDISGVRDGGIPIFAPERSERTGFELSDWITLSETAITVPAGGEVQYSFTMRVPENATPGSHFGGVFLTTEPPEIERSGAAVGYQVANIIHVRVSGDVDEQASVRQFSTDRYVYGSPNVQFTTRIQNEGNVLVTPVGSISINNMFGSEVATVPFNQDSQSAVFPLSERDFTTAWLDDGPGFGRYEAVVSAAYGDTGARYTLSSTVTFWVLPMNIIGPALGVLAVLLLVTYLLARVYIVRTLANYAPPTGRRLVQRRRRGSSITLLIVLVMLVVTVLFLIVLLALFA
jgi:hypothetical protein